MASGCESFSCGVGYIGIGAVTGFVFGSAYGVYVVGKQQFGRGSLLATLAGSVLGVVVLARFFEAPEGDSVSDIDRAAYAVTVFSLPVAGAMLTFNLTR